MLEEISLNRKVSKQDYKAVKPDLEVKLGELQRRAHERNIPVVIVFEGWDAAGKGTLINELILPLDPRGFNVYTTVAPQEEEALRPFLWRFWIRDPARGRIAIFDRSWYRRILFDRVEQKLSRAEVQRAARDITAFERQLWDDGCVIVKFFLHISKKEQKRRLDKLRDNPLTAWRVTKDDLKRHRKYAGYLSATDDMLATTDSNIAPWTVVEAHNSRFAVLKIFNVVIGALERRLKTTATGKAARPAPARTELDRELQVSILEKIDPGKELSRERYDRILDRRQKKLRDLEHEIYMRRVPVVIVYEGWDAAGKGGNIKRLARELDPRGYEVVPIAAPNDAEKEHHYLWRFWTQIPKAGHMTIFDRSWYGRVMVERVERFCTDLEWKRAYREINEFERHLVDFGTVLVKFWLQIDRAEQLRRFKARETTPHKAWKITDEDWRNRKKWPAYRAAVDEMLVRTSTNEAPWTVVESNCKLYARIKTLDTVIAAIERRLGA